MRRILPLYFLPLIFAFCLLPFALTHAHEVYVLPPETVEQAMKATSFDMLETMKNNLGQFVFWGFIAFTLVSTIFFISIFHFLESRMATFFAKLKVHAPIIVRISTGLGLMSAGYHGASFGPELAFVHDFGSFAHLASLLLLVSGALITVGLWTRYAAALALIFFVISIFHHGLYMLTYLGYAGAAIFLLIVGSHRASAHTMLDMPERIPRAYRSLVEKLKPFAFPLLRLCFGLSLVYSALYAKVLHNNLALQVASVPLAGHDYSLSFYFGFDPYFLVLGAAIIEILIGLFFIAGVEIRWTSIFLLFWLSLSLWYFGEAVWPHIVLIGIPIAFIMHGYDKYSLEGYFLKKGRREPVL